MNTYEQQSNGLGVAGFVLSLVGFLSCGLLCIPGALMSAIAMRRQPRGLAIAGLIIGLVGSLFSLVILALIALIGFGAVLGAVGLAGLVPEFQAQIELAALTEQVDEHIDSTGSLPPTLSTMNSQPLFTIDPWGTNYRYVPSTVDLSFTITSAGPDGTFDTADDINNDAFTPSP